MKQDNIAFDRIETVFSFLQEVPMPANVTNTEGKLIFSNRLMRQAHHSWNAVSFSSDAWVGGAKSEWSPDSLTGDNRDAPNATPGSPESLELVAAVRIPGAYGAFVHLYSSGSPVENGKTHDLIGRIMGLAGPSVSPRAERGAGTEPARPDTDWLCDASLRDIIASAAHAAGVPAGGMKNGVDANHIIGPTSPVIIGRMIERILRETAQTYPGKTIRVSSIKKTAAGAPSGATLLSFEIKKKGRMGKRNASELAAIGLRLKEFAHVLGMASGFVIDPPAALQRDGTMQVHFLFPNRLIKIPDASAKAPAATARLSSREKEIMEMARSGYDNESIASILQIATATVKQHLKSIYKKLGIRKRAELIFLGSPR